MQNTPRSQRREATQSRAHAQLHRADTLGARRDPGIDGLARLLEIDASDEGLVDQFSVMLDRYEGEQRLNPNPLPPPPHADVLYGPGESPDFLIGTTTETAVPYGPRIVKDSSTMVVTGITGGGKTTLVHHVIVGLHQCCPSVGVVIFDAKEDSPSLLSLATDRVWVLKTNEIRFNLLRPPPGEELTAWHNTFTGTFCDVRDLRKSRHLMLDTTLMLCERFGVAQDPARPWPSLKNVLQHLKTSGGLFKDELRRSLIGEITGVLNETGCLFDTSDGIELSGVLAPGRIVAIQTDALPIQAQQLVVTLMAEYLIAERRCRNVHNPGLECLLVLDESQLLLNRATDERSPVGISGLAARLFSVREAGVSSLIVAHQLGLISKAVVALAGTFCVMGGLSDADNIRIAGDAMNMPPEARTMFPRLARGQALVREIGKGLYTDPFLVNIDPPPVRKDAIDEPTRKRLMTSILASLPATPSLPLPQEPKRKAKRTTTAGAEPAPPVPALTERQLTVLRHCCEHPLLYSTERMPALELKDYRLFDAVVEQLAKLYLVKLHTPQLGSHKYTFTEVTDAGWAAAGMDKPDGYIGHGSFAHTVLIARVAAHLQYMGWQDVRTEYPVGPAGHRVDVYGISPDGVQTGWEISISLSNVLDLARNSLIGEGAVESLIFLCDVASNCRKVEKILRKTPELEPYMDRIRVERIDQYISGTTSSL